MKMQRKRGMMTIAIGFTYIGAVVGAGFASGQEIMQFFTLFGRVGGFGILLSTILFVVLGAQALEGGRVKGAKSHLDILGNGRSPFSRIIDATITLYLYGSLVAMCAGAGAVVEQLGLLQPWIGSLLLAVAGAFTVVGGVGAVLGAIGGIAPIMMCFVITVSILSIRQTPHQTAMASELPKPLMGSWIGAGFLYVSYNMLGSVPILAPLGKELHGRRGTFVAALVGGLGLGLAAYLSHAAILGNPQAMASQVPLVAIGKGIGPLFGNLYAGVIIAEVYTTAVASLYGLSMRMNLNWKGLVLVTLSAWVLSRFGFQGVVRRVYPLMGFIGLALTATLVLDSIRGLVLRARR